MMGSYTTYDFSESLARVKGCDPGNIDKVIAAWGNIDRDGACCDACGGEWSGGFLLKLRDGRFAYVSGWCDYTGWGCQDGATVDFFDAEPSLSSLKDSPPHDKWDREPADLNKWLADGGKSMDAL